MDFYKKHKKMVHFTLSLLSATALLSMGATVLALCLFSSMSAASILSSLFAVGFYIGIVFFATIASPIFGSPIVLAGLLLIGSGVALGACSVGVMALSRYLSNSFTEPPAPVEQVLADGAKDSLTTNQNDEKTPDVDDYSVISLNWKTGLLVAAGVVLTAAAAAGATALLMWLAADLVVSLAAIPSVLLGMTFLFVLMPALIAISGAISLPVLPVALLLSGGALAGVVGSIAIMELCSGKNNAEGDLAADLPTVSEPTDTMPEHSSHKMHKRLVCDAHDEKRCTASDAAPFSGTVILRDGIEEDKSYSLGDDLERVHACVQ